MSRRKTKRDLALDQELIGENVGFYAAEAYKRLRTNLSFCVPQNGNCRVIGITSSLRGEGKSTTAINLAYTLAQDGKKVLLIDGDMRLPTIAARLEVNQAPGLSEVLSDRCDRGIVQRCSLIDSLHVIAAGEIPPNPSELLGNAKMKLLVDSLRSCMDYIIVDIPPITEVADALVLSPLLDGVAVVVRRQYVTRKALNETLRQLHQMNVRILGFVMTHDEDAHSRYGKYTKK